MNKQEIQQKVEELAPWHYCHILPHGISTGSSQVEVMHDKLLHLNNAGCFHRRIYPKVLDLGANSGIISMWFATNKGSVVTAIEAGPKYFAQLEFVVDVKGYQDKVIPVNQDLNENQDFGFNEYDLILYLGTMHHLKPERHQNVLAACLEALMPGGELVVQTKTELPVAELLSGLEFQDVKLLNTNWSDRAAWSAIKNPMKLW